MFYTYRQCPEAEAALREALAGLAADIGVLPEASLIAGVVLGGGYGRGEGGVTPEGRLYNDLDFLVMPTVFSQAGRIAAALSPLSRKWGEALGLEVDFFVIPRGGWLVRNRSTLMLQELLAGHALVCGSGAFLEGVPRLAWEALPWREGARLMLNRGTGILLAAERLGAADADDFVCRNVHKAVLGCGDAWLLFRGEYRGSGDERLARLQGSGADAVLVRLYAEALQFKYMPVCTAATSGAERLRQVRQLWLGMLPQLARELTGQAAASPRQAVRLLLAADSVDKGGGGWLNGLQYLRCLPHALPLFPCCAHPRLKLLLPLTELLETAGPADAGYLRLWRRLN